jgi:hypothetical protein
MRLSTLGILRVLVAFWSLVRSSPTAHDPSPEQLLDGMHPGQRVLANACEDLHFSVPIHWAIGGPLLGGHVISDHPNGLIQNSGPHLDGRDGHICFEIDSLRVICRPPPQFMEAFKCRFHSRSPLLKILKILKTPLIPLILSILSILRG